MMRNHLRKIPVVGILLALLIASCSQVQTGDARAGKPAPDLSLKTVDGGQFKLSDLKGSVVVLDFWATWCPPCRESLPNLSTVSSNQDFAKRGLKVVAIDCGESLQAARDYIRNNHLALTVALDSDGSAQHAYQVEGIPNTIVVGRDGTVQHTIVGFGGKETEDELNRAIEKALAAPAK